MATKYLETQQAPATLFLKNFRGKLDETVNKEFEAVEFLPDQPRKTCGLLTAVQALGRPLKAGETRLALKKMCRAAFQNKEMWVLMPPHVQQMLAELPPHVKMLAVGVEKSEKNQ